MSNNLSLNSISNLEYPDITLRHGDLRSVVNRILITGAKTDDADVLYQIGLTALRYNRMGFAWAFFKLAAKSGYLKVQKCVNILEDKELSMSVRKKRCAEYANTLQQHLSPSVENPSHP